MSMFFDQSQGLLNWANNPVTVNLAITCNWSRLNEGKVYSLWFSKTRKRSPSVFIVLLAFTRCHRLKRDLSTGGTTAVCNCSWAVSRFWARSFRDSSENPQPRANPIFYRLCTATCTISWTESKELIEEFNPFRERPRWCFVRTLNKIISH